MLRPTEEGRAIRPRHDLSPGEADALEQHLHAFNTAATGYADGSGLAFVAEAYGEPIGAVAGYTWGGVCELKQLWVAETHRRQGLGRQLMQAALAEAAARGCAHVFVATYDFQAPAFYRELGFVEVARIADKPLGHTEYILRHELRPGG